jgi:hypothetical protein
MRLGRGAFCLALGSAAVLAMAARVAQAETRGVVELFTSQGCSSCPPADKLAGELAADPSLVVLSVPIDYWDYLGWKDTLASPKNSARQRAYARMRGDREVYTPQVVINGSTHALGSDRAAIERAIGKGQKGETLTVDVALAGDQLTVSVPDGGESAGGEVWLYMLTSAVPVAVGRGENRGHSITYHNVVRRWVKLGDWSGKAERWTVPLAEVKTDGVDRAAVLVQGGTPDKPGRMLGAAVASLP